MSVAGLIKMAASCDDLWFYSDFILKCKYLQVNILTVDMIEYTEISKLYMYAGWMCSDSRVPVQAWSHFYA